MNTTDHTSDCEAVSVQRRLQVDEYNINRSITVGKKSSSLNRKNELVFLPSIKFNNRFNYFKYLYYVNEKNGKFTRMKNIGVWAIKQKVTFPLHR